MVTMLANHAKATIIATTHQGDIAAIAIATIIMMTTKTKQPSIMIITYFLFTFILYEIYACNPTKYQTKSKYKSIYSLAESSKNSLAVYSV